MNLIYLIIVKPIETILSLLFNLYVGVSHSYGLSIILLSLTVTVIIFPLFYIAEVWKRKEQVVEKRMKKRLAYIKKYYTGQKRYCMIKATHRLEGYTAASSFRTSFGLLIQIPFFFAAYHLLSHYQGFQGLGWFFIKDFAQPDGLLWGLNLLPIAMTVINIVSSSIYMRGSRAKEIVELYIMAALFLILLYGSPSALVLYWTMNNVFSVGKSLIFLRLFPHEKYVPDPEDKTIKDYVFALKETIKPCLGVNLYVFGAVVSLLAFQCWQITFNKKSFEKLFLTTSAIAFVFVAIAFFSWLRKNKQAKADWSLPLQLLFFGACFLCFSLLGLHEKMTHADGSILRKLVFISTLFADILLFISASYFLKHKAEDNLLPEQTFSRQQASLYYWSLILITAFITLFSPVLVYLSSPAETGITLGTIFKTNIPVAAILILLGIGLWKAVKNKYSLVLVTTAIVILIMLYHYVLPNNFGELDRTILGRADKLNRIPVLFYFLDVVMLCISGVVSGILIRKYPSACRNGIILLFVCFCGLVGFKSIKYAVADKPLSTAYQIKAALPADNAKINGYSKDGKNVVLFIADMFSGGYMERILDEHPEYRTKLDGFTWYRNMLAAATETAISMPSIFGGADYLPLNMNEMAGTGDEKVNRAAAQLFRHAESKGYDVSVVSGSAAYLRNDILVGTANAEMEEFEQYWEETKGIKADSAKKINQPYLFSMLAIFQSAPYFLKPVIYNDGGWLIFSKITLFWYVREHVFSEYSFLDLLPIISNNKVKNNTFKYFHSCFTHIPYGIGQNGTFVDLNSEYPDPKRKSFIYGESAYYSARKFMELFIAWTDWLKANNVYDNTYIILVSDHGNDYSDNNPLTPDGIEQVLSKESFNRLNSLLLVKPTGVSGAVKTDDSFASNMNVYSFMQSALDGSPVSFDNSVLYGVSSRIDFIRARSNFRTNEVTKYRVYKVENDIFNSKNWKIIK